MAAGSGAVRWTVAAPPLHVHAISPRPHFLASKLLLTRPPPGAHAACVRRARKVRERNLPAQRRSRRTWPLRPQAAVAPVAAMGI